jgi:putative ABC transport system permease protein
MLKNFFTVAFRNLWKHKFYSLINISGLAVGLSCCLLIVLFVWDDLSYDKHHTQADRTYRAYADLKFGEMDGKMGYLPAPLAPTLVKDFPEVEIAARLRQRGSYLVRKMDEVDNAQEENFVFADGDFFRIFDFEIMEGDPAEGLAEPNTMVISKPIADKYFPEESAIGKVLMLDNRHEYRITSVIDHEAYKTEFTFDFYLSMAGLEEAKNPIWLSHNFHTYFVLRENADPQELEAKFPAMLEQYAGPQVKQFLGLDLDQWEEDGNRLGYNIQPMKDVHLYSADIDGFGGGGNAETVVLFVIIALVILIIAAINFMNLSTARSAERAREVGVRKVLGSYRNQLIWQFMIESILLSVFAMILSVGISALLLPIFNELSGKSLELPWTTPIFPLALVAGAGLIGLLAGIYPALFLSSFQPVAVLKSRFTAKRGGKRLRSVLVILQFAASISLIIFTIVVQQQMSFVKNKQLGYAKEQVLVLDEAYTLGEKSQSFKNEMLQRPEIVSVTMSDHLPTWSSRNNNAFWRKGKKQDDQIIMQNWEVDHDYIKTLDMEIIKGRDFDINMATDSQAVILNEAAIQQFGFEGDPIGQYIETFTDIDNQTGEATVGDYKVIGVIKNFHFESLKNTINSLGLFISDSREYYYIFKTGTQNLDETLAAMEAKWKEFNPGQPFNYSFLDERFNRMYQSVEREGEVFGAFAFLAILVACLGLFALAAFMAETRTKEIGIRKVLGATVPNIMMLLSRDFLGLVIISIVIASGFAGWFADRWLEDFAYRTSINVWTFLIPAVMAIAIALGTVSYHAAKAALGNPAKALKDE